MCKSRHGCSGCSCHFMPPCSHCVDNHDRIDNLPSVHHISAGQHIEWNDLATGDTLFIHGTRKRELIVRDISESSSYRADYFSDEYQLMLVSSEEIARRDNIRKKATFSIKKKPFSDPDGPPSGYFNSDRLVAIEVREAPKRQRDDRARKYSQALYHASKIDSLTACSTHLSGDPHASHLPD